MAALAAVAGWLSILSIVLLLTVRQIALLTERLDKAGTSTSLDRDGIDIGVVVPDKVIAALPQLADGRTYLLLLSSICGPCREMATALGRHAFEDDIVALVPGPAELAETLIAELPSTVLAIADPVATDVASHLQLESTPFAFAIEGGRVTGKAYLHSDDDFLDLLTFQTEAQVVDLAQTKGVV